jgi:hypothetical protein
MIRQWSKGEAPVSDDDTRTIITRSFVERRSGVDTRSLAEQQRVGERRSGLDRRQTTASSSEDFARQALSAQSVEQKLDLLARATIEMASALAEIERRVKSVQRNMANQSL